MTEKTPFTTIDEYISTFPADIQAILEKIRQAIHEAVPEATETMRYGMPTFDLNGQHLVFFAGWKQSISLYPLPAGDAAFQQKIAPYKKEKSTLRFPFDKPLPYDLIREIVPLLKKERANKEKGER
jgi:uncharacterized protein YdhG (YjbR/CyaY superfamily)